MKYGACICNFVEYIQLYARIDLLSIFFEDYQAVQPSFENKKLVFAVKKSTNYFEKSQITLLKKRGK